MSAIFCVHLWAKLRLFSFHENTKAISWFDRTGTGFSYRRTGWWMRRGSARSTVRLAQAWRAPRCRSAWTVAPPPEVSTPCRPPTSRSATNKHTDWKLDFPKISVNLFSFLFSKSSVSFLLLITKRPLPENNAARKCGFGIVTFIQWCLAFSHVWVKSALRSVEKPWICLTPGATSLRQVQNSLIWDACMCPKRTWDLAPFSRKRLFLLAFDGLKDSFLLQCTRGDKTRAFRFVPISLVTTRTFRFLIKKTHPDSAMLPVPS